MADEIPQALKQADINLYKTATRAAQLSTVKPIVAYWCMMSLLRSFEAAPRGIKTTITDFWQASTGWSTRSWPGTFTAPMRRLSTTQLT